MKVSDVMTRDVQSCTRETNLAAAAEQMWNGDCGTLPVIDDDGRVIGMITDRDICIAAATRHRDIAEVTVGEVTTGEVQTCTPGTNLRDALRLFAETRVRRLPVVSEDNKLQGILSIKDVLVQAGESTDKKTEVSYADVVNTLKAICAPHTKTVAASA
jgi:CBS domain-containing protein